MSRRAQFIIFKEHLGRIPDDMSTVADLLQSVDESVNQLLVDVDRRIDTEKRLSVLIRGSLSLIETCNSLMINTVLSPPLKQVFLCFLF